jgi:ATP-dependent exoDNAse (exonuclease V) alpha subunit
MAIFHFQHQIISRKDGKSAVASASYRSGENLRDERYNKTHRFKHRSEMVESFILLPDSAPEEFEDRETLWNAVEAKELRGDSQLAREINVALPREVDPFHYRQLLTDYCEEVFTSEGMIADVAIHLDNPENPHAHIMLTMRDVSKSGFGNKNREWNSFKKADKKIEQWREVWANAVNKTLEFFGFDDRIDHRSYKRQGSEKIAMIHESREVREMEKRGIHTDVREHNEMAKEHNAAISLLESYDKQLAELEKQKDAQKQKMGLQTNEKGSNLKVSKQNGEISVN